jgi:glycosyltransferase involved in cell wall biosynthesis
VQVRLLLAGPADRETADRFEARRAELGLGERVRHLGFVPPERLAELYAGAAALVLSSLEEGFGRPALDAMSRGVPVIASDIAALRELTGSAAYLVDDPLDRDAWRAAISTVLGDAARREALVSAGHERAKAFAWRGIAEHHRDVLKGLAA